MCHSSGFRRFALCLAIVGSFGPESPARAAEDSPPGPPVYHADPGHLWNGLHEALLVRVGPDGRDFGRDRLEPLLWPWSKHLLEGPSRDRLLAVLEEFLRDGAEARIADPLRRAILQRDLWLVFNWLDAEHGNFEEPQPDPDEVRASRERLRGPLAEVIGRLALRPDQIERLPDNYAAAVASGEFPKEYDPEDPDAAYLPDLFAAGGPWVCLGPRDGPVAPAHMSDDSNAFTNSAFLLFLRLPAGRAATLAYLDRLRVFGGPLLVQAEGAANPSEKFETPR